MIIMIYYCVLYIIHDRVMYIDIQVLGVSKVGRCVKIDVNEKIRPAMVDENFGFWTISSRPAGPHAAGRGPAASKTRRIRQRDNDDGGSPARTIYGGPAARRAAEPWLRWRRPHRRRPENSVLCPPSHSHVWAAAVGIFGSVPFIKPPVPTSRTFISTSTADQQPHTSRRPAAVVQIFFVVNR